MEEAGGKYDSTVRAFVFDKNPMDIFEADGNVEDRTADNLETYNYWKNND